MNKSDQKQKRYATYVRHASQNKKDGDSTILSQGDANALYVAGRGGVVVAEYNDDGVSGTTLKRTGLQKLLEDVKMDLFDVVVVTDLTRIARQATELWAVRQQLEAQGVSLETSHQQDEDVARKVSNSLQELFSKQIGIMTRKAKEQMVVRGHFAGGAVAFGYDAVPIEDAPHVPGKKQPKSLVLGKFAYAVARAFAMSTDRHSTGSIADYLQGETGESWTMQRAHAVLRNKVYTGRSAYQQVVNPAAHPAIVSEVDFDAVQALLNTRITHGVSKTPPSA